MTTIVTQILKMVLYQLVKNVLTRKKENIIKYTFCFSYINSSNNFCCCGDRKANWLVAKTNQAMICGKWLVLKKVYSLIPRSVGVRRGGRHQPQQMALTNKIIKKTNWLVAKTNQTWKNPPTSLRKFGLAIAVENYPQSHLSQARYPLGWCSATNRNKWH